MKLYIRNTSDFVKIYIYRRSGKCYSEDVSREILKEYKDNCSYFSYEIFNAIYFASWYCDLSDCKLSVSYFRAPK